MINKLLKNPKAFPLSNISLQNRENHSLILAKQISEENGKLNFLDFAEQLHQIYLKNPKAPIIVKHILVNIFIEFFFKVKKFKQRFIVVRSVHKTTANFFL